MGAGVVTLREGFEASLVVVLVLAFLDRTGRRKEAGPVWAGVAAGIAVSVAAGAALFAVGAELDDEAEAAFEGATMIAAAALLTWMIFWMRSHAGSLRAHLEHQVGSALAARSAVALGAVVFLGVVREGLETALLLFSSAGATGDRVAGVSAAVGLAAAVTLGYLFYRGVGRLDLRRFFAVTSILLLLFAAWLLARGLEELAELDAVPAGEPLAWLAFALLAAPTLFLYLRRPARRAS